MRKIEYMTVNFIPATVTIDDPRAERAYFTWKALIDGTQYGQVFQLDGSLKELPPDQFRSWTLRSLDEIEKVRRMTPSQLSAAGVA